MLFTRYFIEDESDCTFYVSECYLNDDWNPTLICLLPCSTNTPYNYIEVSDDYTYEENIVGRNNYKELKLSFDEFAERFTECCCF